MTFASASSISEAFRRSTSISWRMLLNSASKRRRSGTASGSESECPELEPPLVLLLAPNSSSSERVTSLSTRATSSCLSKAAQGDSSAWPKATLKRPTLTKGASLVLVILSDSSSSSRRFRSKTRESMCKRSSSQCSLKSVAMASRFRVSSFQYRISCSFLAASFLAVCKRASAAFICIFSVCCIVRCFSSSFCLSSTRCCRMSMIFCRRTFSLLTWASSVS
mmetsp:Transcript_45256/g.97049  ORF Transcript_45256/g.97049 Transcript_45256/m.97049 type:complete len:222 (+) Transcript_45256:260-925(+)